MQVTCAKKKTKKKKRKEGGHVGKGQLLKHKIFGPIHPAHVHADHLLQPHHFALSNGSNTIKNNRETRRNGLAADSSGAWRENKRNKRAATQQGREGPLKKKGK